MRNLERAGVPRSVAMKVTGHKTEAVYRRDAIVSEADIADALQWLDRLHTEQHARPGEISSTLVTLADMPRVKVQPKSRPTSGQQLIQHAAYALTRIGAGRGSRTPTPARGTRF